MEFRALPSVCSTDRAEPPRLLIQDDDIAGPKLFFCRLQQFFEFALEPIGFVQGAEMRPWTDAVPIGPTIDDHVSVNAGLNSPDHP